MRLKELTQCDGTILMYDGAEQTPSPHMFGGYAGNSKKCLRCGLDRAVEAPRVTASYTMPEPPQRMAYQLRIAYQLSSLPTCYGLTRFSPGLRRRPTPPSPAGPPTPGPIQRALVPSRTERSTSEDPAGLELAD